MPLSIHFRCGEGSLGLFINDVLSFLCSVEVFSLRDGWEPEGCAKDMGKGKRGYRGTDVKDCWPGWAQMELHPLSVY